MSQPGIGSFFTPHSPATTAAGTTTIELGTTPATTTSALLPRSTVNKSYAEVCAEREARRVQIAVWWNLPPRKEKKHRGRGAPPYNDKWIEGLHLVAIKVAAGKMVEPAASLIALECPTEFKKKGFVEAWVEDWFKGKKTQAEEDDEDGEPMEVDGAAPAESDGDLLADCVVLIAPMQVLRVRVMLVMELVSRLWHQARELVARVLVARVHQRRRKLSGIGIRWARCRSTRASRLTTSSSMSMPSPVTSAAPSGACSQ
eukprot:TRINITY_DN55857_c0_g1_i1.p2 TRINITY_DN55857_c0_g1~~TRINITY_DN55857_c0_g1_i1.p2  ORF type:complete len:258 (+),score=74.46 TRINITY_DN55857_c0_g1_i1:151-924(+)